MDVNDLGTLSSATVAVLLRARRLCRARGGDLVLHHPQRSVLAALRRSGLDGLFEVVDEPHPHHQSHPQAS